MEALIKVCQPCKDTQAARFQDRVYGNQRVMNPIKTKPGQAAEYRCTVCGTIHK